MDAISLVPVIPSQKSMKNATTSCLKVPHRGIYQTMTSSRKYLQNIAYFIDAVVNQRNGKVNCFTGINLKYSFLFALVVNKKKNLNYKWYHIIKKFSTNWPKSRHWCNKWFYSVLPDTIFKTCFIFYQKIFIPPLMI